MIKNIFFNKMPLKILLSLLEHNVYSITELHVISKCSYSHVIHLIKNFEKFGIVTTNKGNREREVDLTILGRDLALELKNCIG